MGLPGLRTRLWLVEPRSLFSVQTLRAQFSSVFETMNIRYRYLVRPMINIANPKKNVFWLIYFLWISDHVQVQQLGSFRQVLDAFLFWGVSGSCSVRSQSEDCGLVPRHCCAIKTYFGNEMCMMGVLRSTRQLTARRNVTVYNILGKKNKNI